MQINMEIFICPKCKRRYGNYCLASFYGGMLNEAKNFESKNKIKTHCDVCGAKLILKRNAKFFDEKGMYIKKCANVDLEKIGGTWELYLKMFEILSDFTSCFDNVKFTVRTNYEIINTVKGLQVDSYFTLIGTENDNEFELLKANISTTKYVQERGRYNAFLFAEMKIMADSIIKTLLDFLYEENHYRIEVENVTDMEKVYLELIERQVVSIECVPENIRTYKMYEKEVKKYPGVHLNMEEIPEKYRTKELYLLAINKERIRYEDLPDDVKDYDNTIAALKFNSRTQYMHSNVLPFVPKHLLNRELYNKAVSIYGRELSDVPEEIKTQEMCMLAVKQYGAALEYVPESMKTEEMCKEAVKKSGNALKYVPEEMKTQKMCMVAVQKDGRTLEYVPENMKTEKLCMIAVKEFGEVLKYVPQSIITEGICIEAVKKLYWALSLIPDNMKTEKLCMIAVEEFGEALKYVPEEIKTEKMCMIAVRKFVTDNKYVSGFRAILEYVPHKLKNKEMCIEAVKRSKEEFRYVPIELRTEEVCIEIIKTLLYTRVDEKKMQVEEMCMEAVKRGGYALEYVPERIKTQEMCMEAVKGTGYALKYVPEEMKTEEMCMLAVMETGWALGYVPKEMKTQELCIEAVRRDNTALKYVPEEILAIVKQKLKVKTDK